MSKVVRGHDSVATQDRVGAVNSEIDSQMLKPFSGYLAEAVDLGQRLILAKRILSGDYQALSTRLSLVSVVEEEEA